MDRFTNPDGEVRIIVAEPVPWSEHRVVFTTWRYGRCACGLEDFLRPHLATREYACLPCWLDAHPCLRQHPYHGYEDDARLYWLWNLVSGDKDDDADEDADAAA